MINETPKIKAVLGSLGYNEVKQNDIQVGDLVYAIRREPEEVLNTKDRDGDLETGERFYNPEFFAFYVHKRVDVRLKVAAEAAREEFRQASGGETLLSDEQWERLVAITLKAAEDAE